MAGRASRENGRKGGRPKGAKHRRTLAREAGQARALREAEADAAWTMRRIAWVADSDLGDVFDDAGQLRSIRSLPVHVRKALASVKTLKTNLASGDGQQETTREVKFWDKMRALELLAKHFGLVTDRHDVTIGLSQEFHDLLDAWKAQHRTKLTR